MREVRPSRDLLRHLIRTHSMTDSHAMIRTSSIANLRLSWLAAFPVAFKFKRPSVKVAALIQGGV